MCTENGTTPIIFELPDFVARLAALARKILALRAGWALPEPHVYLTRFDTPWKEADKVSC